MFQCKDCDGITDAQGLGNFLAKGFGAAVGVGLSVLTLGLLPDEVNEAVGGFVENLLT
jgi:hypothetical protein